MKIVKVMSSVVLMGTVTVSVLTWMSARNMQDNLSQITLQDVESITRNEVNECGDVTFIPDEALRSAQCWNGGTHLKCKAQDNVCCNPATQTECAPLFGGKGKHKDEE